MTLDSILRKLHINPEWLEEAMWYVAIFVAVLGLACLLYMAYLFRPLRSGAQRRAFPTSATAEESK